MGSLDGSIDCSNDVKVQALVFGDSLVYTDGKVFSSDEDIKLVLSGGKMLCNILGNVDGFTLGIGVGTELGSINGCFDGL